MASRKPPARPAAAIPLKQALKTALLQALEHALATARAAHQAAVEGATHEEARPENDKDTRGLEQSYLARGHAQRVAELEIGMAAAAAMPARRFTEEEAISVGALVTVVEDGARRRFLVAPHGGGLELTLPAEHASRGPITVLTLTSPLGRALVGKRVDDECELGSGPGVRTLEIAALE